MNANAALAADTHWAKQVDKASSAFAPDPSTTETLIYRRFA